MSADTKARKRRRLVARDGINCAICKNPMTERTMTIDHIIPLSLGGTHDIGNLRLAHRRCNGKRGSKLVLPEPCAATPPVRPPRSPLPVEAASSALSHKHLVMVDLKTAISIQRTLDEEAPARSGSAGT